MPTGAPQIVSSGASQKNKKQKNKKKQKKANERTNASGQYWLLDEEGKSVLCLCAHSVI
jgi:hypothetical protein